MPTDQELENFKQIVWGYFRAHKRVMPWRDSAPDGSFDPYKILISEVMLQQTQVVRVVPKYQTFLARFPSIASLADAPLSDVLTQWSGLGYNRRAKFLHQSAQVLMTKYGGKIPKEIDELSALPGIGVNTAAAIIAYSFNKPVVFIETNIRTVFLHHFFQNQTAVKDDDIIPLAAATLDEKRPREWYWALMDYGSFLKQTQPNPSRRSKHFVKQSRFEGSKRQIRGQILKLLAEKPISSTALKRIITDARLPAVLAGLETEGLIQKTDRTYHLPR